VLHEHRVSRPPSKRYSGQSSTMWRIVCASPHSQFGLSARPQRCFEALHLPWSDRKRFRAVQDLRGNSNPSTLLIGSWMIFLLRALHRPHALLHSSWMFKFLLARLVPLRQNGSWDFNLELFSQKLWIGRSGLDDILLYSLSVAASRLRWRGSIWHRTGSHFCVSRFNCTGDRPQGSVELNIN
jgi:hypothetical protein